MATNFGTKFIITRSV